MFYVTLDRRFERGGSISQGDYIGLVAGPGGDGYVDGFSHLHLTI
jgi:hypothetical protein